MKNQTDGNSVPPENAGEYGKFKTAGDLLAAYNALESEFTKKCQSLKRLQAQLELFNAQAEADKPTGDPPSPPPNSDAERDGAPPIATAVATPPPAENFARAADTSDPNDPFDDTAAPQDATAEVAKNGTRVLLFTPASSDSSGSDGHPLPLVCGLRDLQLFVGLHGLAHCLLLGVDDAGGDEDASLF